jgi:hypothetical protein
MRRPQAKDISDQAALEAIKATRQDWGKSMLGDVEKKLSSFPSKVVKAKLSSMIRRGIIDGCDCGCSGNFEILRDS